MMDAMQHFFRFSYAPRCGFPSVTLLGTVDDWQSVRRNAEEAIKFLTLFDFAFAWLPALLPILDRFVAAAKGEAVDACFWNAMCKRCGIHDPLYRRASDIGYNGW